ncbi:MAG: YgaP family membrane protein [Deinococcota bacterium]
MHEGTLDRIVRLMLTVGLFYLAFTLSDTWAIVTDELGVVMLATAALGYCSLYALLVISTCPVRTDSVIGQFVTA